MLRSFTVRNFRNAAAEDLPLKRVNLLIGPNNSGKTNLMRAMAFATTWADTSKPDSWLAEIGGKGARRRDAAESSTLLATWTASVGELSLTASLAADLSDGPKKKKGPVETKLTFTTGGVRVEADLGARTQQDDYFTTSQEDKLTDSTPALRPYINGHTSLFVARISPTAASEPVAIAPADTWQLGPAGEGLPNVLRTLEQLRDHGLGPIEDRLRELIPDLKRVIVRDGGQYRWLELNIGGQRYSLPEMSDGTLKSLILATVLEATEAGVLHVDEPELNQHPSWLRRIGAWLQRPRGDAQVVISTHSSDLLDAFTEGFRAGDVNVIVCDTRPGVPARAIPATDLDDLFEAGWELGDLYRVGEPRLGGWPW